MVGGQAAPMGGDLRRVQPALRKAVSMGLPTARSLPCLSCPGPGWVTRLGTTKCDRHGSPAPWGGPVPGQPWPHPTASPRASWEWSEGGSLNRGAARGLGLAFPWGKIYSPAPGSTVTRCQAGGVPMSGRAGCGPRPHGAAVPCGIRSGAAQPSPAQPTRLLAEPLPRGGERGSCLLSTCWGPGWVPGAGGGRAQGAGPWPPLSSRGSFFPQCSPSQGCLPRFPPALCHSLPAPRVRWGQAFRGHLDSVFDDLSSSGTSRKRKPRPHHSPG